MKITKQKLKQIIKEELGEARLPAWDLPGYVPKPGLGPPGEDSWPAAEDIEDAIQMLNAEVEDNGDPSGTLFHVINRLEVALDKLVEA